MASLLKSCIFWAKYDTYLGRITPFSLSRRIMEKQRDIKVTTYGTTTIHTLSECEQKIFYTTLLKHVQELYQKSK
jgi:hypothetical protein